MMRSFLPSRSQSSPLVSLGLSRIIVNRLTASVLHLTYAIRNLPVDETARGKSQKLYGRIFFSARDVYIIKYWLYAENFSLFTILLQISCVSCGLTLALFAVYLDIFAHLHKSKDEYRPFIHRFPLSTKCRRVITPHTVYVILSNLFTVVSARESLISPICTKSYKFNVTFSDGI